MTALVESKTGTGRLRIMVADGSVIDAESGLGSAIGTERPAVAAVQRWGKSRIAGEESPPVQPNPFEVQKKGGHTPVDAGMTVAVGMVTRRNPSGGCVMRTIEATADPVAAGVETKRHDEGAGLPRPRPAGVAGEAQADRSRSRGCGGPDHDVDDLRHGPSHPEGRRPDGHAGPDSRARRRRRHRGRRSARVGVSAQATACSSRASARAGSAMSCRKGMYSHCRTGGWILGNTIDGTQAEYVRIPHADTSLYHCRRTWMKKRS